MKLLSQIPYLHCICAVDKESTCPKLLIYLKEYIFFGVIFSVKARKVYSLSMNLRNLAVT